MRVLLHACCGPCLIESLEALSREHEVDVLFANPNIDPAVEHDRRRDTLVDYAAQVGVTVVEASYDPEAWNRAVIETEEDPAARCAACYRLRLGMAARRAAEGGYEAIATTLTVSPHQDAGAIREAGNGAASKAALLYLDTDFTSRYGAAVERSRELGMYRQRYCGCRPSRLEAEESRRRQRG